MRIKIPAARNARPPRTRNPFVRNKTARMACAARTARQVACCTFQIPFGAMRSPFSAAKAASASFVRPKWMESLLCTLKPAARLPSSAAQRSAPYSPISCSGMQWAMQASTAPRKQSPAPAVLTGLPPMAGMLSVRPPAKLRTPRFPSVIKTERPG